MITKIFSISKSKKLFDKVYNFEYLSCFLIYTSNEKNLYQIK